MKRIRRWLLAIHYHDRLLSDVWFYAPNYHGLAGHKSSFRVCDQLICVDERAVLEKLA